ncbi:MAG: immunoglobulin domain-containing protein, partial [Verrucomicrobiae bacterium]|nr:immunoglobulin domain-containing protein [Verrucomicrobiae bacterium]
GFMFTGTFAIGARAGDYGGSFFGAIDEVAVYGRALSAAEIEAIYAAGSAGKCVAPTPPFIVTHPRSTNVLVGSTVTFSVVAGGTEPLSYQWRFNGTNLPGATAPTLTLTNVQFSQAGAYSVLVTNALGSALSSNATLTLSFPTAVVRIASTNIMAGRAITLPVLLSANGNENGLGFSLSFNTQRLAFASAALGNGAAGATLLVNATYASTGRLGVVVAFPPQQTFAPGTQEVVRLQFETLPLTGITNVTVANTFVDQPVLRELYGTQLQSLPAFYSNGTVTLQPTSFEADVTPRPGGNQAITATDWSQAGRFAARLDVAGAGGEFQRADCAPRATLGDGQLKVTDWVQTGRYLAGLDPLAAVGGPTVETFLPAGSTPGPRQLRLSNTNAQHGQTVTLSVTLDAQGDENALGFTVAFNPEAFVLAGLTSGADAAAAHFIGNTNDASSGRVGVALSWPAGLTLAAGARELARVALAVTENFAGVQPVSLGDQVVTRCASDAFAGELPMNFLHGAVTVVPPNPNPAIGIVAGETNVTLFWPRWAADFTLQTLAGTHAWSGAWSNLPVALQTNGPLVSVTLPAPETARYFRLFRP